MGELVESWQVFPRSRVSWFMWRLIDWYWSSVQSIVICHEISFLKGNNSHNLLDWIRLVSSQGKTFNFLVAIKIKKKKEKKTRRQSTAFTVVSLFCCHSDVRRSPLTQRVSNVCCRNYCSDRCFHLRKLIALNIIKQETLLTSNSRRNIAWWWRWNYRTSWKLKFSQMITQQDSGWWDWPEAKFTFVWYFALFKMFNFSVEFCVIYYLKR